MDYQVYQFRNGVLKIVATFKSKKEALAYAEKIRGYWLVWQAGGEDGIGVVKSG